MAVGTLLASSDDMRNYLVDQFNLVLRRPGAYGNVELGDGPFADRLTFPPEDQRRRPEIA
ncbi:hypothetical protein [Streptomyces sp. V2I9]|uniref:hypothetical protein n=1 Tax=Streptomyces sp. V2I9 TaxID=3042304 RepID=UPI00278A142E|nr:hypothetical protein [Streptomyces sp. V2I9]MDQ0988714.1 hypothetical protein [Streptomyces sp. V2I9]